jgi:hypothetical protein
MDKFIGFDIDNQKAVACVVQEGHKERFATLPSNVEALRKFLPQEKQDNHTVQARVSTLLPHLLLIPFLWLNLPEHTKACTRWAQHRRQFLYESEIVPVEISMPFGGIWCPAMPDSIDSCSHPQHLTQAA